MLRIGQLRAVQRAAYFQPMGRRRVFILDGAETMRWDVANVFLKILEEPPGSATLILTAPSPYSLLPTIVSRCLQFHFAPLPQADVEKILKEKTDRKPAEIKLAAQLAEGSPGLAMEMNVEAASKRRRMHCAFWSAPLAAKDSRSFSRTPPPSPRTASPPSKISSASSTACSPISSNSRPESKQPVLRNVPLAKELESLAKSVDSALGHARHRRFRRTLRRSSPQSESPARPRRPGRLACAGPIAALRLARLIRARPHSPCQQIFGSTVTRQASRMHLSNRYSTPP